MKTLSLAGTYQISGGNPIIAGVAGAAIGITQYTMTHQDNINPQALAAAAIGGATTSLFGLCGIPGRIMQVLNTMNTVDAVNKIHANTAVETQDET